jgi:hypothetical protein
LANSDGASEWHLRAIFEAGLMRFGTRSGAPYEFANSISIRTGSSVSETE